MITKYSSSCDLSQETKLRSENYLDASTIYAFISFDCSLVYSTSWRTFFSENLTRFLIFAIHFHSQVDLNIIRKSECVETINILYIVLGVIAGIVVGGLILLLIYKLVITIDDRRELAKFEQQGQNMRWEMAENPIFESPTTKVINPTYEETGY